MIKSYSCDEPGCSKLFSRSDHLLRHKRNHENVVAYACSWPGCQKKFVRKDVLAKHENRHRLREQRQSSTEKRNFEIFKVCTSDPALKWQSKAGSHSKPSGNQTHSANNVQPSGAPEQTDNDRQNDPDSSASSHGEMALSADSRERDPTTIGRSSESNQLDSSLSEQRREDSATEDIPVLDRNLSHFNPTGIFSDKFSINYVINNDLKAERNNYVADRNNYVSSMNGFPGNNVEGKESREFFPLASLEFLLKEDQQGLEFFDVTPSNSTVDSVSTNPTFESCTTFNFSTTQSSISDATRLKLFQVLPNLLYKLQFSIEDIGRYLESYWHLYHPQFPIIHRPSFATEKAHPLLLLTMIAMGAAQFARQSQIEPQTQEAFALAQEITLPLRALIVAESEDLMTVKSWVVQILLILESFEITSSSRKLHRRANLHRGLKMELLCRSRLLGGELQKIAYFNKSPREKYAWENWIEMESLKRCCFMAFLIDAFHAVVFGHMSMVFPNQVKLPLPCPDEIWESSSIQREDLTLPKEIRRFNTLLAEVLRRNPFQCSPFVAKILLTGLVNVTFHIEQYNLQVKALKWKNLKSTWKDELYGALDFWYDQVCQGIIKNSIRKSFVEIIQRVNQFDEIFLFSVFHISQTYLRIVQYDSMIFAGAPVDMNIRTDYNDYQLATERVNKWAASPDGPISLAHCMAVVLEVTLDEGGKLKVYEPNSDTVLYRPNVVAACLVVLWDYVFAARGPESDLLAHVEPSKMYQPPVSVSWQDYLAAVLNVINHTDVSHVSPSGRFTAYGEALAKMPDLHRVAGLLQMFGVRLIKCESQLCREYGRLLLNCIKRSMGAKLVMCEDMFEDCGSIKLQRD